MSSKEEVKDSTESYYGITYNVYTDSSKASVQFPWTHFRSIAPTILRVMEVAAGEDTSDTNLTFSTQFYSKYGYFVTAFGGVSGFYTLFINGKEANFGASYQTVSIVENSGVTVIDWKFTVFDDIKKTKDVHPSCIRHINHPIHKYLEKIKKKN